MKIEFISIFNGVIKQIHKKAEFKIGDTVRISKYIRKLLDRIQNGSKQ